MYVVGFSLARCLGVAHLRASRGWAFADDEAMRESGDHLHTSINLAEVSISASTPPPFLPSPPPFAPARRPRSPSPLLQKAANSRWFALNCDHHSLFCDLARTTGCGRAALWVQRRLKSWWRTPRYVNPRALRGAVVTRVAGAPRGPYMLSQSLTLTMPVSLFLPLRVVRMRQVPR